jgi:hypothetical protein
MDRLLAGSPVREVSIEQSLELTYVCLEVRGERSAIDR